jgi:hypothetical protein
MKTLIAALVLETSPSRNPVTQQVVFLAPLVLAMNVIVAIVAWYVVGVLLR